MKLRRSIATIAHAKAKQLRRQVAALRQIHYSDDELIRLAAEAFANWKTAADTLRREGLVTLVPTHFGDVMKKHPAVEAERQFHAEYVARLYDLQIVTKDKKAVKDPQRSGKPVDTSNEDHDPLEGLTILPFKEIG
jgi:hypothetical protein